MQLDRTWTRTNKSKPNKSFQYFQYFELHLLEFVLSTLNCACNVVGFRSFIIVSQQFLRNRIVQGLFAPHMESVLVQRVYQHMSVSYVLVSTYAPEFSSFSAVSHRSSEIILLHTQQSVYQRAFLSMFTWFMVSLLIQQLLNDLTRLKWELFLFSRAIYSLLRAIYWKWNQCF